VFGGLTLGSCHSGGACFGRPSLGIRLDDVGPNFGDCEQIRALKAGIVPGLRLGILLECFSMGSREALPALLVVAFAM